MKNTRTPRRGALHWRRVLVATLLATCGTAALAPPAIGQAGVGVIGRPSWPQPMAAQGAEIEPALLRGLQAGGSRSFVVEFRDRADLSAAQGMDWQARGRHVHEQLRRTAERSQAAVRAELARRGVASESFWIKNVLFVRDGDFVGRAVMTFP